MLKALNKKPAKTENERKRKSRDKKCNDAEVTYCINPLCMREWTEDLSEADDWLQCEGCNAWFCDHPNSCKGMVHDHESLCKKAKKK